MCFVYAVCVSLLNVQDEVNVKYELECDDAGDGGARIEPHVVRRKRRRDLEQLIDSQGLLISILGSISFFSF